MKITLDHTIAMRCTSAGSVNKELFARIMHEKLSQTVSVLSIRDIFRLDIFHKNVRILVFEQKP